MTLLRSSSIFRDHYGSIQQCQIGHVNGEADHECAPMQSPFPEIVDQEAPDKNSQPVRPDIIELGSVIEHTQGSRGNFTETVHPTLIEE